MTVRDFDICRVFKIAIKVLDPAANQSRHRRVTAHRSAANGHRTSIGWREHFVCVLGWSRVEFVVFLQSRQKNTSVVNNGTQ